MRTAEENWVCLHLAGSESKRERASDMGNERRSEERERERQSSSCYHTTPVWRKAGRRLRTRKVRVLSTKVGAAVGALLYSCRAEFTALRLEARANLKHKREWECAGRRYNNTSLLSVKQAQTLMVHVSDHCGATLRQIRTDSNHVL